MPGFNCQDYHEKIIYGFFVAILILKSYHEDYYLEKNYFFNY